MPDKPKRKRRTFNKTKAELGEENGKLRLELAVARLQNKELNQKLNAYARLIADLLAGHPS